MSCSTEWRLCSLDAKSLLRQYLEQRREAGESEFVLDSLSVADAMRLLGAREQTPPPAAAARGAPPPVVRERPPVSDDWRATLRAAGAAPDTPPPPKAVRLPAAPPASAPN